MAMADLVTENEDTSAGLDRLHIQDRGLRMGIGLGNSTCRIHTKLSKAVGQTGPDPIPHPGTQKPQFQAHYF